MPHMAHARTHGAAALDPLLTIEKESRSRSRTPTGGRTEQSNCKCKRGGIGGGLPLHATVVVSVVGGGAIVPLCRQFEEV